MPRPLISLRADRHDDGVGPQQRRHMTRRLGSLVLLVTVATALAAPPARAADAAASGVPDMTAGGYPPEKEFHDWTLGATGMRGWMYEQHYETDRARQISVTQVDAGSPAWGIIEPGDVLLGAGGQPFRSDARQALATAIAAAETEEQGGVLPLLRWRAGVQQTVDLHLAVLGSYSATAPYTCRKSTRILEAGCAALAARMHATPPDRRGQSNGVVRALNALALLASGRPEYLPLVTEEAHWAATVPDHDRSAWMYGYITMFLADYALATHDPAVLPGLRQRVDAILAGQSSIGTWGHDLQLQPSGNLLGYGAMNQPGLSLAIALVLARQAGVTSTAVDIGIARCTRYFSFYVGKGCIPYGDHPPWMETHDDNGKCAAGAVFFDLLGQGAGTDFFARMSTASFGPERDLGHTGNFFNLLWALPGCSRGGPQATGAWMHEFSWYYDLARRWDGTFIHQGEPIPSWDESFNRWDATGAYLLAYALPLRATYITGAKTSAATPLSSSEAKAVIETGRGWDFIHKATAQKALSVDQLITGLSSWSPIYRERCAQELALRPEAVLPRLITLLGDHVVATRTGACQALAALGTRAADGVPALRQTLSDADLWTRVKAAEALARIGPPARVAVPELLRLVAAPTPPSDPRGMLQRFIGRALFAKEPTVGLLATTLQGVDQALLYPAVEAVLTNQDGWIRNSIASILDQLSFPAVRPLLPALRRAVVERAPSGEMFGDYVRLSVLTLFAKNHLADGVPLCWQVFEPDRGFGGAMARLNPYLLDIISTYGGGAKSLLPDMRALAHQLAEPAHAGYAPVLARLERVIAAVDAAPAVRLTSWAEATAAPASP